MAALNRPTTANYEVHENIRVDTQDNEDHTFCGVLFPIRIKEDLPVSELLLHSVAVRGRLGPMTVWVSKEDAPTGPPPAPVRGMPLQRTNNRGALHFRLHKRYWIKVYDRHHGPSMRHYQTLDFSDHPVVLKPGTVRAIYIHSSREGDEAIVYDNTRHVAPRDSWERGRQQQQQQGQPPRRWEDLGPPRYEDNFVAIYTGKAHLSTTPFGQVNIWGWDNAWRDYREFVGQLQYGTVFQLWQPVTHNLFGPKFHVSTQTMLALQRRAESPVSMLPDECIFYILNMCRWDWFQDTRATLKEKRRARKARQRQEQQEAAAAAAAEAQATEQSRQQQRHQRLLGEAAATVIPPLRCATNPTAVPTSASTCRGASLAQNRGETSLLTAADQQQQSRVADPVFGSDEDDDSEEEDDAEMDDDDDDDDDYANEDAAEDDAEEQEEDEDDEDEEWDRANGYRANSAFLIHRYISSDEEDDEQDATAAAHAEEEREARAAWFRRHFARIHILQALGQDAGNNDDPMERVVLMHMD